MDYPHIFVVLMGMGTVFFGLVCLIVLTTIMGRVLSKFAPAAPAPAARPVPAAAGPAVPAGQSPDPAERPVLAAAISAALAEELGTDISGLRILSMRRVGGAPSPDRQALAAAVSAAIAEELGADITGIRIRSMKRL